MSEINGKRVEWITIEWHPVAMQETGRIETMRCSGTHVREGVLHVYGYPELNVLDQHFPTHHIYRWFKPPGPDGV